MYRQSEGVARVQRLGEWPETFKLLAGVLGPLDCDVRVRHATEASMLGRIAITADQGIRFA